MPELRVMLLGQISASKNHIGITRTGRRYPNARFSEWSAKAMPQVIAQRNGVTFTEPCSMVVEYVPGDRRIRDFPAICDGILHILERSGILANDCLVKECHWIEKSVEKDNPRCLVVLRER